MTADEAADRLEITQVWNLYFRAMDTWEWELLDRVFTPDARLRYQALAGADCSYAQMLPRWREFNPHFSFMQHMGGELVIEVDGDRAVATSNLRAVHVQTTPDGDEAEWVIYGDYRDVLRRTEGGWRICERRFRTHRTVGRLLPFDRVLRYESPPWLSPRERPSGENASTASATAAQKAPATKTAG